MHIAKVFPSFFPPKYFEGISQEKFNLTMSGLFSVIFVAYFLFGAFCASKSQSKTVNESPTMKPNESDEIVSELQRRKEIAQNYMNTLAKAKETWIDPYEMTSHSLKERQEFTKSSDKGSVKSSYNELPPVKPDESEPQTAELKRRKEIADKYLSTLAKAKDPWVDPYEMISYPQKEHTGEFTKSSDSIVKSSYNLNSDEEPLFSDIRGDVIGRKISNADVVDDTDEIVSGGHFSKDRQQVGVLHSIYISRWLKKLILKAENEFNAEPSFVTFPLDASLLDSLKKLSSAKSLEIAQLDELICSMLALATVSQKEEYDWTAVFDYAKYVGWAVVSVFFAYLLYFGFKYHLYRTCFLIFFAIVVFWHWMHLYQQRIAFKHAELSSMSVPNECRKHDFGFLENVREYFVSFFKSDNCVKYHEALLVDPMWEVSISVAVSEAITATLLQPISVISRVTNNALKQLFDGLTWETKILIIILIFLSVIMMFNYRIRLPFLMGAIEPHYPSGSCVENLQPQKSIIASSKEKLCNMVQYVQDEDFKSLRIQQDMNLGDSLPGVFQNKSLKCTPYSHKLMEVNWKPNKRSDDDKPSGSLEVCKNNESFEDNDSEGIDRGIEKCTAQCEHCCSGCLSSDDVQYLHDDCRVCNSEESRNSVISAVIADINRDTVLGCTNCCGDQDVIDDLCIKKSNICFKQTNTNANSSMCTGVTKHTSETSDL